MAAPLKASLQLTLEDKLSAGLGQLQKQIERLRNIAGSLGLGELENALDQLRGENVDRLAAGLKGVGRQADAATASLERLRAANENVINVNGNGVAQLNRSLGALVVVPGGGGAGGGRGGGEGGSVPFGAPLLLPGPPGAQSGIPLNFSNGAARFTSLGGKVAAMATAGGSLLGATKHFGNSIGEASGGIMGSLMAGFALIEPMREAAEYDNILRHIAITAGATGAAGDKMVQSMKGQFKDLALATFQTSNNMAESAFYLIQAGMPKEQVDRLTLLSGKVATAYNAQPEDVAKTSFALAENLHVSDKEMGTALAALAVAGKSSHVLFPEMSQLFPQIAALGGLDKEHGLGGTERLVAMLAIARKNTATGGEAATNLSRFLTDMNSPFEARHFKDLGVNLPAIQDKALKRGVDPLEAVIQKVRQITQGNSHLLGKLFHNTEDLQFVQAMISHLDEYLALKKKLAASDERMLNSDFNEGAKSQEAQLRKLTEYLHQAVTRIGDDFNSELPHVLKFFGTVASGIGFLDKRFPGLIDGTIKLLGGLVALAGVLAVLGTLSIVVSAGWTVLTGALKLFGTVLEAIVVTAVELFSALTWPIALVIAAVTALAAAAYDIYENWGKFEPFFVQIWDGIKNVFEGFLEFIKGVFTLDFERAWAGIKQAGGGLGQFYTAEWNVVKGVFNDFVTWLDSWTGGLGTRILDGIKSGWKALVDGFAQLITDLENRLTGSALGRMLNLANAPQIAGAAGGSASAAAAPPAPAPGRADTVDFRVSAEPGTKVSNGQSSNPNHTFSKLNTGQTVNLP